MNWSIHPSLYQTTGWEEEDHIGALLTPKIYSMHRVFFEFPSSKFYKWRPLWKNSKKIRCFELILGVRNAPIQLSSDN